MIAGYSSALVFLINSWVMRQRERFLLLTLWVDVSISRRSWLLEGRNQEPGGCDPIGTAVLAWRIRLAFGRAGAKPRKTAYCLKTGSRLRKASQSLCLLKARGVTQVVGNLRREVKSVISELVKCYTAHLWHSVKHPQYLMGEKKVSVCKNSSCFSHIWLHWNDNCCEISLSSEYHQGFAIF